MRKISFCVKVKSEFLSFSFFVWIRFFSSPNFSPFLSSRRIRSTIIQTNFKLHFLVILFAESFLTYFHYHHSLYKERVIILTFSHTFIIYMYLSPELLLVFKKKKKKIKINLINFTDKTKIEKLQKVPF